MPLSQNDVEAEISYAYVHAVAAAAGMNCQVAGRGLDNMGVDTIISARDQFAPDSILTDISIHFQLKATSKPALFNDDKFSYPLERKMYDILRRGKALPFRFLVVLFLPSDNLEWLQHSHEFLTLKKCAYWVSLRDAPETENSSSVTVYVPKAQPFSPEGIRDLMTRISLQEDLKYGL